MHKKSSYPGYSILLSINTRKDFKFSYEKDQFSIKFRMPFFTIMVAKKDLNNLLESYLETVIERIKELENIVKNLQK